MRTTHAGNMFARTTCAIFVLLDIVFKCYVHLILTDMVDETDVTLTLQQKFYFGELHSCLLEEINYDSSHVQFDENVLCCTDNRVFTIAKLLLH